MTEIGEVMKRLDIPGAEWPPEDVLAAANEAASVGGGGLWRNVRHKWVVGLIAIGLVGVPTAFALSSSGGDPNLTDTLLAQRRDILRQCIDSAPRPVPAACAATFEDVRECLRTATPREPSCASAVPLRVVVGNSSVPLKDFVATQAAERPVTGKVGSILRNAEKRLEEIPPH